MFAAGLFDPQSGCYNWRQLACKVYMVRVSYAQHLADNLEDFDYPEEAIRASLQKAPSV